MLTMQEYHDSLLCELRELSGNINEDCCALLQSILGQTWIDLVHKEIGHFYRENKDTKPVPSFHSPFAEPFLEFTDKETLLEFNRIVNKINTLAKKKKVFRSKLKRLCIGNPSTVREVIFEINACGKFAMDSKLVDIEVKVHPNTGSNVDAKIKIDDRSVLVEAILISKRLGGSERTGVLSIDKMMKQIRDKILEKATLGKQLALAQTPTILVIGLPSLGADLKTSKWQIENSFIAGETKKISAVIIAGSFLFRKGYIFYNSDALHPISRGEKDYLNRKFCEQKIGYSIS